MFSRTWTILGISLVCLLLIFSGGGCGVRRASPIRYIPGLGDRPDYSMEGILRKALEDKNPVVRRDAVRLLGTMTKTPEIQQRSAKGLGKALRDKEEDIRLESVRSLANISPGISGPYLREALNDKSVRVRIQVIQVLREVYQRQDNQIQGLADGGVQ